MSGSVENLADGPARIEAVERILQHDLQLGALASHIGVAERENVGAFEADGAAVGLQQPQQAAADRRLAGTALADQSERFARPDRQRDAIHRLHHLGRVAHGKSLDEASHLDHRRTIARRKGRAEREPPFAVQAQHRLAVGVLWRLEELLDQRVLDDAAVMQHQHPVAIVGDDAELLRNEQHRRARRLHGLPHLVEKLRLDRHVEAARRLVGDEQLRPRRERDGDERPLRHAAGKLVRISLNAALGIVDADHAQHFQGALARLFVGRAIVGAIGEADLAADAQHRIKGAARILDDDADFAAADIAQFICAHLEEIAACEVDAAGKDAAWPPREAEHCERRRRLAAARIADEADDFAPAHREAQPVDRADHAATVDRIADGQFFDREERTGADRDGVDRRALKLHCGAPAHRRGRQSRIR